MKLKKILIFLGFEKMKKQNYGLIIFVLVLSATFVFEEADAKSDDDILPTPCVNGITRTRKAHEHDLATWKTCKWQRMDLISWLDLGFDMNDDGGISMEECEYTRKYYFSEAELVWGESCETVFQRCDCDGDGFIIYEDFRDSEFSCLKDCGAATRLWYFVGSRMTSKKAFDGKQEADQTIDKSVLKQ